MELYRERGFEQTTVADIASRAGLTERTFYRYFVDKREVLFSGAAELQQVLVDTLSATPAPIAPLDAVGAALAAAAPLLQARGDFGRVRQRIIAENVDLQERELIKFASLAAAMAAALRERGVPEPAASLAGESGVAVFRIAFRRWQDAGASTDFGAAIQDCLSELKVVTAGA